MAESIARLGRRFRSFATHYSAEASSSPAGLMPWALRQIRRACTGMIIAALMLEVAGMYGNSGTSRVCAAPPTADKPSLTRFQFSEVEMGVPFTLTFYAAGEKVANKAAQEVFARLKVLNGIYSDYDSQSELSRLAASSREGEAVRVSPELWKVLAAAQQLSKKTEGAFDITVGPYVRLWRRARRNGEMPSSQRMSEARAAVGFGHLRLVPEARTVELLRPKMRLDLGGIAKGEAVDEALRVLARHGIDRALVDAGGDLAVGAAPPDRPGWRVALAPLDPKQPPTEYLLLTDAAVATSGDAIQFVEIDGQRYSHIVDPHTGLGLTQRSSVTIVAPNCRTADSLASAVSVLGPERGLALVNELAGVEAFVVTAEEDNLPKPHASKGWQALPRPAETP